MGKRKKDRGGRRGKEPIGETDSANREAANGADVVTARSRPPRDVERDQDGDSPDSVTEAEARANDIEYVSARVATENDIEHDAGTGITDVEHLKDR